LLSKLKLMSRTARAATAFVAVFSAAVVAASLGDVPLWLQMIASLLTVLTVGSLLVFFFSRRRDQ
jgi:hypothetical protein